MSKLSLRLQTILDQTLKHEPLWDVCCDHGLLGLEAYELQTYPEVIFVDQVTSIMQHLKQTFDQRYFNPRNQTQTRFMTTDGGELKDEILGSLVIAGVGGLNMKDMLTSLRERKVLMVKRLVLAPHRNDELYSACDFLPEYKLSQTLKVEESKRERSIFVFDRV